MERTVTRAAAGLLLVHLAVLPAWADGRQPAGRSHGDRVLRVLYVEQAPTLDGVLDEPEWQLADVADGFMQRESHVPLPATEPTEIRVLTDGRNLYFGVHCFDSDPGAILARDMWRGARLSNDDDITILLDTFHDHRNAFLFRINPLGTQQDGLIRPDGTPNYDWHERWEAEARVHAEGWSAEIKIPLKALRFSPSEGPLVFGIDFRRIIRRKNEVTAWSNYNRHTRFFQLSEAGHLIGLEGVGSGLRVRVKPYVNAEMASRGFEPRHTRLLGGVGLEDVKVPISPGLTLDLAVNPDFAQTEVDDQVVNFDRVPTFFPEKREFFLEGGGLFDFGLGGRAVRLYHSRRIGLADDAGTVPILAGAKLTGRVGQRFTLGLLNMQTGESGGRAGDNFSVLRVQRDILSRSSVGLFLSNRQAPGSSNRVVGWDQHLMLFRHLNVTGLFARSFTSGDAGAAKVWGGGWAWSDDLLTTGFDYYTVDEHFRADVGFLSRVGVARYSPHFQLSPRPRAGPIRQYGFSARLDHFRRLDGNRLETEIYRFLAPDVMFHDSSSLRFGPAWRTEVLDRPLRPTRGLVVPPGAYRWWSYPVTYTLNAARKFTGTLQFAYEPGYFGSGGQLMRWGLSPTVRFNHHLSTDIAYSYDRVRLPGGEPVHVHVMNNRLNVTFSRRWATSTLFQYSNTRDLIGINFRLRHNYRPGDDLYVVINTLRAGPAGLAEVDRSVTVKFTRSFDF